MINLISQAIFEQSDVQQHQLGALGIDKYGDRYRYVKAGAAALVVGELIQEPAEDTNFRSMVVAENAAIGARSVLVTLGGTAVTAGLFSEGSLWVESGTGVGQQFHITKHEVQATTTGNCRFYLDRPLDVALVATTSQVSVRKNSYGSVIEFPTTPTGGAIGVALNNLAIGYFGWLKSGGNSPVLFDNTDNSAADAQGITPSLTVAGSVKAMLAADVADVVLGWSLEQTSVDSTMGMAHLTID